MDTPPKRRYNVAQRAVVHVQNAAPNNAAGVDAQLVAPVDVVLDHRGEQVVRGGNRVKIAREVQVHFFHRNNLSVTATGSTTLHAKAWAKRGFANTDRSFLADGVQAVTQTNGRGGLTFTGRGRVDGSNEDQLAILLAPLSLNEFSGNLGFVVAKRQEIFKTDAEFFTDLLDRLFLGFASNFNVGLVRHGVALVLNRLSKKGLGGCFDRSFLHPNSGELELRNLAVRVEG